MKSFITQLQITKMPSKSIITLNGDYLNIAVERQRLLDQIKKEISCSMLSIKKGTLNIKVRQAKGKSWEKIYHTMCKKLRGAILVPNKVDFGKRIITKDGGIS